MEKVLEVKGLTKLYKNNRGVRDISFDIEKGDIFGFLGPNGAGKTTAMKAITGLCRSFDGEVRIFGSDVRNEFENAIKRVGCLIERPEAFEYMSGYNNLKMAARYYRGLKSSRPAEVLELVGLEKYASEKVGVYSLGMKQRLGLAAALLSSPDLVILDEPANGLDIEGTVDIRNIIKRLAKENGTTFFISSHLVHEMELTCTRIGVIYEGELVASGTSEELIRGYSTLEDCFIAKISENRRLKQ